MYSRLRVRPGACGRASASATAARAPKGAEDELALARGSGAVAARRSDATRFHSREKWRERGGGAAERQTEDGVAAHAAWSRPSSSAGSRGAGHVALDRARPRHQPQRAHGVAADGPRRARLEFRASILRPAAAADRLDAGLVVGLQAGPADLLARRRAVLQPRHHSRWSRRPQRGVDRRRAARAPRSAGRVARALPELELARDAAHLADGDPVVDLEPAQLRRRHAAHVNLLRRHRVVVFEAGEREAARRHAEQRRELCDRAKGVDALLAEHEAHVLGVVLRRVGGWWPTLEPDFGAVLAQLADDKIARCVFERAADAGNFGRDVLEDAAGVLVGRRRGGPLRHRRRGLSWV